MILHEQNLLINIHIRHMCHTTVDRASNATKLIHIKTKKLNIFYYLINLLIYSLICTVVGEYMAHKTIQISSPHLDFQILTGRAT